MDPIFEPGHQFKDVGDERGTQHGRVIRIDAMQLNELLWVDWIGLTLAAYGLVAGAVRGLTQQFSRLLVWGFAVLAAGVAGGASEWLAERIASEDARALASWEAWLQLALILAAVPALGALRRLVLGRGTGSKTLADTLLGAISGLIFAALVWMLVWGTALQTQENAANELADAKSAGWARVLSRGPASLPDGLRSPLLEFPLPKPDSEDEAVVGALESIRVDRSVVRSPIR
jgi:uncharacterized membrane protein required for colicin V production